MLGRAIVRALIAAPSRPAPEAPRPKPRPRPSAERQAEPKPQAPPPRPEPSPRPRRKAARPVGEGMDLATARGMYGLNGGPFSRADILARDEDVMAAGHGNAEYEAKTFQARAVLMQHAEDRKENR